MPTRCDAAPAARETRRPSSHLRNSAATELYVRFAAAEAVVLRRLRQLAAIDAALQAAAIEVPARNPIDPPVAPERPLQFAADAEVRRSRSTAIVERAIAALKRGKCKSRSPSKAEIVEMSRRPEIDPDERGISKNVFRTNQACLDLFIAACLPFDAERRKQTSTPSWVVRMKRKDLIALVVATERDRDQSTRDLMIANELLIGAQVASIRREVVREKAKRMLVLAD